MLQDVAGQELASLRWLATTVLLLSVTFNMHLVLTLSCYVGEHRGVMEREPRICSWLLLFTRRTPFKYLRAIASA
jgi:hypothetical protein